MLEVLSLAEAHQTLSQQLLVTEQKFLLPAVAADHLRAMIYFSSRSSSDAGASQTIHTTRLVSNVRRSLGFLWPDIIHAAGAEMDIGRSILESVSVLGDAARCGHGFWAATPRQLFEAPSSEDILVTGSAPLEDVESDIDAPPIRSGVARFIRHANRTPIISDSCRPIESWFGQMAPLNVWTDRTIEECRKQFSQPQDISPSNLEVYYPGIDRSNSMQSRWVIASSLPESVGRICLFRPIQLSPNSYNQPHYMGTFQSRNGQVLLRQSTSVDYSISLRLRFGIDAANNRPRTATITRFQQKILLEINYRLPDPEDRILSLGWPDAVGQRDSYKRTWFHVAAMPFLQHALQRIAIRIVLKVSDDRS